MYGPWRPRAHASLRRGRVVFARCDTTITVRIERGPKPKPRRPTCWSDPVDRQRKPRVRTRERRALENLRETVPCRNTRNARNVYESVSDIPDDLCNRTDCRGIEKIWWLDGIRLNGLKTKCAPSTRSRPTDGRSSPGDHGEPCLLFSAFPSTAVHALHTLSIDP